MSRFSLSRFFPTPAFLKMPAVGLDVSDQAIHFIELEEKKAHFEVKRFGMHEFHSKNPVVTEDQELREAVSLVAKKYKFKYINASLPEEKAYLFKTDIPKVEHSAMRSSIEFKLEEQVPIPLNQAVFDYDVIRDEDQHEHLDVSVTVLPENVISGYISLFESAGLTPLSFEIEPQALSRAVIKYGDKKTYLLVNFASTRTGLAIVRDGIVHFSSTLTIGGNSLTSAIKKHLNITNAEAERVKREHGFMKKKDDEELLFSLMSTMSVLRDEMNRVAQYWRTREKRETDREKNIDAIVLCGEDVTLNGFEEYFTLSFQMPVTLGNVWSNVSPLDVYAPPIPFRESFAYGIAVGLALPKRDS